MDSSTVSISCDDCRLKESDACQDCLVSFVLGRDPEDAVVIDVEEARTIRQLTRAGLVPSLRFTGGGGGAAAG